MLGLIRKFAQWPWPLVRSVEEAVSNVWTQLRQGTSINENEVTETSYASTARFENGKAVFEKQGDVINLPAFTPLTKDFTIELRFQTSVLNRALTLATTVSNDQDRWIIYRLNGGKVRFILYSGVQFVYVDSSVITSTEPTHVAVVRKDGIIRLYVDGKVQGNPLSRSTSISQSSIRLSENTVEFFVGTLWDVRFSKEALYDAPFTPGPLPPYVRPAYSVLLASKIAAQYGLRRNSLEDEAGNGVGKLFGTASVVNGRLTQTSSVSNYFQLPIRKFGAADFTIEFNIRLVEVNASYGCVVLGHLKATNVTSDDNRWFVWVGPDGRIGFGMARSANANDVLSITSPNTAIQWNIDHHIVVERVGITVTLYVDGKAVISAAAFTFPIRGAEPFYARSLSTQNAYTMSGSVWNVRIADTALYKGNVVEKPTFPSFVPPFTWPSFQLTKAGLYDYDEVTGHNALTTNGGTVDDGVITTVASTASRVDFSTVNFDQDQDFTIEAKWNAVSVSTVGGFVIGVWNTAGQSGNSWCILQTADNKLAFAYSVDGLNSTILNGTRVVPLNTDHHVAVVRRNGVISMFVDGVLETATLNITAGSFKSNFALSTSWNQGFMSGKRWDIRIVKGRAEYSAAFTPKALVPFYRPTYTLAQMDKILHQWTFRENIPVDEITGQSNFILQNAGYARGRIVTTTASSSNYYVPVDYFGAADFTMECNFRVGSITNHVDLMTQHYSSSVTNANNRYAIRVLNGGSIQVLFNATSGAFTERKSAALVALNRDYHLVVERLDGVITAYLDGVSVLSFTMDTPLWATVDNKISGRTDNETGYGAREIWNIRIASKALYKGVVKRLPSFPRPLKMFAVQVQNTSVQALEPVAPNKILTDHNIQNTSVQILESQSANKILTDHNVQNIVVQALVKI